MNRRGWIMGLAGLAAAGMVGMSGYYLGRQPLPESNSALMRNLDAGAPSTPESRTGGRVALVIGNSDYNGLKYLPNPRNDAVAVARALRGLEYRLVGRDGKPKDGPELDLNQEGLMEAVTSFAQAAQGQEIAFLYYAGHGFQDGVSSYLVPVDAPKPRNNLDLLKSRSVALDQVIGKIDGKAQLAVAVFDACREIPELETVTGLMRASGLSADTGHYGGLIPMRGGVRKAATTTSRLIAYAGAPGQLVKDGAGEHSPYTQRLLDQLDMVVKNKNNTEITYFFQQVAWDFKESGTTKGQEPLLEVAAKPGSFYLLPGGLVADAERQRQTDAERQRQADAERQRQADVERQRQADVERQRQTDAERQQQADAERQRQADAERQRQADVERQRQADVERQRQADVERQRQADAAIEAVRNYFKYVNEREIDKAIQCLETPTDKTRPHLEKTEWVRVKEDRLESITAGEQAEIWIDFTTKALDGEPQHYSGIIPLRWNGKEWQIITLKKIKRIVDKIADPQRPSESESRGQEAQRQAAIMVVRSYFSYVNEREIDKAIQCLETPTDKTRPHLEKTEWVRVKEDRLVSITVGEQAEIWIDFTTKALDGEPQHYSGIVPLRWNGRNWRIATLKKLEKK